MTFLGSLLIWGGVCWMLAIALVIAVRLIAAPSDAPEERERDIDADDYVVNLPTPPARGETRQFEKGGRL